MNDSQLMVILKRLIAMTNDYSSNRQKRIFEKFGIPLCDVTYVRASDEFVFVKYRPYERFRFDDIDLVASEVFNCLYDLENTF